MVATTIRLPDDLYERLRQYAFKSRQPLNKVVSVAVEWYLELGDAKP